MIVFVRRAIVDDVDTIVGLIEAVHDELAPERGGPVWLQSEAREQPLAVSVRADIETGEVHVMVGGIDEVVLGVAVTRLRTMHDNLLVACVDELVVDPEARGVGIGVGLLDDAVSWAQEVGAVGIESSALPGQRATKNFFEAAGMKARLLTVYAPLVAGDVAAESESSGADEIKP